MREPAQHDLSRALAFSFALLAGCGSGDQAPATTGVSAPSVPSPATAQTGGEDAQAPVTEKATAVPGPVYRFAKISNGAYFFTGSPAEKETILVSYPDFRYEGIAYLRTGDGTGQPVYRFANLGNGGYFYTASVAERDFVRNTRPDMRYEGSTFSVDGQTAVGSAPVYRLANLRNGAYLYTVDNAERQFAVGLGFWRDEGLSFYALPSSAYPNATASVCFNGARYLTGTVMVLNYRDPISGATNRITHRMLGEKIFNGKSVLIEEQKNQNALSTITNFLRIEGTDVSVAGNVVNSAQTGFADLTSTFSPNTPQALHSLPPGSQITRNATQSASLSGRNESAQVSSTHGFSGFEDVTVPEGTFRGACRFSSVLKYNGLTIVTETSWLARGSGVLIKSTSNGQNNVFVSGTLNGVAISPQ
jgi:hypothetical protein